MEDETPRYLMSLSKRQRAGCRHIHEAAASLKLSDVNWVVITEIAYRTRTTDIVTDIPGDLASVLDL